MATELVHILTLIGRRGAEALAGIEALIDIRRRVARAYPEDFVPDTDPLLEYSDHDEPVVAAFCLGLIAMEHRLPTLYASSFVHNFTGPRKLFPMLMGDGTPALRGLNFSIAGYGGDRADRTLARIASVLPDVDPEEDREGHAYLSHVRAAIVSMHAGWRLPYTVVTIEQCIGSTRECYDIEDAVAGPLGVPLPVWPDDVTRE